MRAAFLTWAALVTTATLLVGFPARLTAFDGFGVYGWLTGGTDVHPHECDECGRIHDPGAPCIERIAVEKCVIGKKELFKSKIRYEYASIPETRYRWKKRLITKEIPCPYCKPVCKTEDGEHCFGQEWWDKECTECGELHCKHIAARREKEQHKVCSHEPGETTIKVHYWSCIKEPYTIYRQVKQEVCVKQPYYEKVEVNVTKYVCEHGNGDGCSECGS